MIPNDYSRTHHYIFDIWTTAERCIPVSYNHLCFRLKRASADCTSTVSTVVSVEQNCFFHCFGADDAHAIFVIYCRAHTSRLCTEFLFDSWTVTPPVRPFLFGYPNRTFFVLRRVFRWRVWISLHVILRTGPLMNVNRSWLLINATVHYKSVPTCKNRGD